MVKKYFVFPSSGSRYQKPTREVISQVHRRTSYVKGNRRAVQDIRKRVGHGVVKLEENDELEKERTSPPLREDKHIC